MIFKTQIKKDITSHIRGFFVTHLISFLGENNILSEILKKRVFELNTFKKTKNKEKLQNIFKYLSRIGYLKEITKNKKYELTKNGEELFLRSASFYVPYSYNKYMSELNLLVKNKNYFPTVNRKLNILGSGKTHKRYFLPAISYLKNKLLPTSVIDIGLGNGDFVIELCKNLKLNKIVGIDFSRTSINEAKRSINKQIKNTKKKLFICDDGANIKNWGKKVKKFLNNEKIVITMWFLIHEISNSEKIKIQNFLKNIYSSFPKAQLIICELVNLPTKALNENKDFSVIPEYLFFHDLSNQGVMSWNDLRDIFRKSPYKVSRHYTFDEINFEKRIIPSTVVSILEPKKK